jgi:hypothetical protein
MMMKVPSKIVLIVQNLKDLCASEDWGMVAPLWWVIDIVVWTDSWPSIAGAGCSLVCVGAVDEQARKVYACVASEKWRDK